MKPFVLAAALAAVASAPSAGEMFSGTHTYRPDYQQWMPVPAAGFRSLVMVGDYVPASGPIPAGRVECRGTNFWTKSVVEADGVCVFGEAPDSWMLRYRMTSNDRAALTAEQHRRIGEWTAVEGTGKYSGITGSGTYFSEGEVGADGLYRTQWEGEVTIRD